MKVGPLHLLPLALVAAAPAGAPITVTLTGVASSEGQMRVSVCREAGWMKPGCPYSKSVPAQAGTMTITVPGVPAGTYAVVAEHDKNGNGKIDRNMIGLPTEMIGFSNDAPVKMSPPKFADARIVHGAAPQSIAFKLRKLP